MRAEADRRWVHAFEGNTRAKPSYAKKTAALKSVIVELTRILFNNARNQYEPHIDPPRLRPELAAQNGSGPPKKENTQPDEDNRHVHSDEIGPRDTIEFDTVNWSKENNVDPGDELAFFEWIREDLARIDTERGRPVATDSELENFESLPIAERVEILGNYLHDNVLPLVERQVPQREQARLRLAFTDHLWCGILAEIAHFLDTAIHAFDAIPDRLVDAIYRSQAGRAVGIDKFTIKLVVGALWRLFKKIPVVAHARATAASILETVRILGFLICKAPERHAEVVQYCVDPLGKQLIGWVKKQVVSVLQDWVPHTAHDVQQMEQSALHGLAP